MFNTQSMGARTLYQVLVEAAERYGEAPALRQPAGGDYLTYSWNQYRSAAEEIAAGLRSLGIGSGEIVALNSETRLEFYLADLGIITNGSVAAALYPNYPAADLLATIAHICARVVFVEDPKTFSALRRSSHPQPPVSHWILLTGEAEGAMTLDQLRQRGRTAIAADPARHESLRRDGSPFDPAILYLTSGATGEPKMALVTHAAVVANIDMAPIVLPLTPQDATVVFLPSAHIAQRVVMEFVPLRCGTPVTFSESLLKLPQEIRKVRPTILLAPPRMWERIYSTICAELRKRPALIRKVFYGALGLSLAAARYRREGIPVPRRIQAPLRLADRLLFRTLRARFGGRVRIAASGAAPLSKDLAEFYEAIGMPLIEGYGLTEGGVATLNPLDSPKPGSIGKAAPGVELRLAEDGELLIKSPCLFSGYLRDPNATAEVLRDGWLHTGDLAYIDAEGYVFITGRKKEIIVSSTGKKVFPARIENFFKTEPLISQVLLIGDRLPFVTALFTINPAVAENLPGVSAWRRESGANVSAAPAVIKEIQKAVARVNRQLAPFEQIRKYRVLERDFSIDQGELTATMKVRRSRAIANFRQEIDELYAGRES
jgi:long-chain acyl-CoA synthetase